MENFIKIDPRDDEDEIEERDGHINYEQDDDDEWDEEDDDFYYDDED